MSIINEVVETVKALAQGLKITLSYIPKEKLTQQYPEEPVQVFAAYRGEHFLNVDEHGKERCVACFLCSAACPANAIYIEAAEDLRPYEERPVREERYAKVYNIDYGKCILCGFCVDACPKDAIWMTRDYELAFFNRQEAIFGIDKLVAKPGLPVKDGLGYRPYYPGDGTRPPGDASSSPVIPGDGERANLREKGIDLHHTEGPGPLNRTF